VADERVSIVIDIDVKDVASIAAVQAALANLNRSTKQNAASMRIMRGQNQKTTAGLIGAAKGAKTLQGQMSKLNTAAKIFQKTARVLLFTVIGMGIEFVITAASLASVNLVFATGRFLVKAYNFTMQALAGTLAAVGVAALGAAAAFREVTAAQQAFRFKGSNGHAAGIADATGALRNLYADSTLATAGITALNQAFAAVTKNSAFTPQTQAGLKAMMDFAAASGDTTKGLSAAASFLGLMQKESKFTQEALAAAAQVGPEFDKALKKLRGSGKIKDTKDLMTALQSGALAKEAGVAGAADAVSLTLVAQFKGYMTQLFGEMASIGQDLLNPFKKALFEIFIVVRRTIRRVSSDLVSFGKGGAIDAMVSAIEKISDFSVNLFRKYLPAADGFFARTNKVFVAMERYTRRFLDVIRPLQKGGTIIIETFGKPISEIFKAFGRNIRDFSTLATENKDKFLQFGESLKNLVAAFFDMSHQFKEMFTEALPIINRVINALALLIRIVGDFFGLMSKTGPLGAFMPVLGAMMALMKGRRAGGGLGGEFLRGSYGLATGNTPFVPFAMRGAKGPEAALAGAMGGINTAAQNQTAAANNLQGSAQRQQFAAMELSGAAAALSLAAQASMRVGAATSANGMAATIATRQRQNYAILKNSQGQYIDPTTGKVLRKSIRTDKAFQEYMNRNVPDTAVMNLPQPAAGNAVVTDATAPLYGKNSPFARMMQKQQAQSQTAGPFNNLPGFVPNTATPFPGTGTPVRNPFMPVASTPSAPVIVPPGVVPPSVIPSAGGRSLTGAMAGFRSGVAGLFPGFRGNAQTAKQSISQYYRAMKVAGKNRSKKVGAGLKKTALGLTGSSLMSGGYRQAIMDQQAEFVKGGGDPANFKAKRGAAAKSALRGNMGLGSMALGMGASYLGSKFGTEESQGALQAGAGLMMMSPLAGIGVAGIGTAMSSQTTKGGVLSGMAGGAATGALIGSFIPGIGTALGGIIGAGVGGLVGWWKSDQNKKKMRDDVQKRMSGVMLFPIAAAMVEGSSKTAIAAAEANVKKMNKMKGAGSAAQGKYLDKLVTDGLITKEERERALEDPNAQQDLFTKLDKDAALQLKVTTKVMGRFDKTMHGLTQATGMTQEEIMDLASRMGVDLYDETKTLEQQITALGKAMKKTAIELDNAIKDVVLKALDKLENFKTNSELTEAIDSAQNAFNANPNMDTVRDVIGQMVTFLQTKYPNNQSKVLGSIFEMFDPQSPNYVFGKNGPLGNANNMPADKRKEMEDAIRTQFLDPAIKDASGIGATQIGGLLSTEELLADPAAFGKMEGAIAAVLRSGDQGRIDKMQTFLKYGNLAGKSPAQAAAAIEQALGFAPGTIFRGGDITKRDVSELFAKLSIEKETQLQLTAAVANGLDKKPSWWDNDVPDWWTRGLKATSTSGGSFTLLPGDDTKTPRAKQFGDTSVSKRLRSTLGAHAAMDGRLTGKRTITSSYRTFNLGSPSSDHASGAAYDLTGQNLGQYAKMIRSGGGFAEFHGVNANRHLHVVPKTGDTYTTKADSMGGTTPMAPVVNVNVYPSPGMNVDQLVAKTIRAQEKAMRDIRERT